MVAVPIIKLLNDMFAFLKIQNIITTEGDPHKSFIVRFQFDFFLSFSLVFFLLRFYFLAKSK